MSTEKSPLWFRAFQIGLGIVILILSIITLINPVSSTIWVIFILAFMLILAGIKKEINGLIVRGKSRFVHLGLGIIVTSSHFLH
jgi:uncharacterized membrane protein HdeD (DUF308 family)